MTYFAWIHRRPRRAALLAAVLAVAGLAAAGVAYAQLTQIAVFTGTPDQATPAAEGNVVAWSRNGPANNGPYNAYVRVGSGPITRVNGPGTAAFAGGFSGDRLIYQRVLNGQSDLRFYNVVTHTYGLLPAAWNSLQWEWAPTVSGHYVLFGRRNVAAHRQLIVLGDLSTGQQTALAILTGSASYDEPGQVNGNYATWTQCADVNGACHVYLYDIATKTTTEIPNTFTSGSFQFGSSVTSTGTVYFFHSTKIACGTSVSLNKVPLGGTRTLLVSLSKGLDAGDSYVDDSNGTPVVYYQRFNCAANQGDIYKVVD